MLSNWPVALAVNEIKQAKENCSHVVFVCVKLSLGFVFHSVAEHS